jgi:hypothetical protein
MHTRWWPSLAVCAFILGVIAVAMNFDRDTTIAAASPVVETRAEASAAKTPIAAAYVGNTNSYRFHRNSCTYAGCKNCTARFATREEAIAAGYRPCGTCNP